MEVPPDFPARKGALILPRRVLHYISVSQIYLD